MKSSEIVDQGQPAYEVRVPDNQLRVYMQTQTLAGPQQPRAYLQCAKSFREHFVQRPRELSTSLGTLVELENSEAQPSAEFNSAIRRLFEDLSFDKEESERLIGDIAWKFEYLPHGQENVLSVGCGGGAELIFLRARYPNSKITAVDYKMYVKGGKRLLDLLNVEFIEGDVFNVIDQLSYRGDRYDLIFSNHVIEHFYEPDQAIARLCRLLRSDGVFSAGLPLDAYPFSDLLARKSKAPLSIHALDLNWLDLRHPWKTNEPDLAATLRRSGLGEIVIYRRAFHTSTTQPITVEECRERERRGRRIHAVLMQPVVMALKAIFGPTPPRRIARLLFALDRRLWFGLYRLKIDVQPDILVRGIRGRLGEGNPAVPGKSAM
jgi:SAM-dependent methyltransferase